jgi:hypothetical protein
MDTSLISRLQHITLTNDEEEQFIISDEQRGDRLEACALSLIGRFLSLKPINRRAAKDTMRAVWRMGTAIRIIEVGNDLLQFQFSTEFQLQWVLDSGPWAFDNNLLVLRRWERGMSAYSVNITQAQFWVQVWGLPFDLITPKVGTRIGNSMGRCVKVDHSSDQTEQARYIRIQVEIPLDKPLRRGGNFINPEGEKCWAEYRYERLPSFCFLCGLLGHEARQCPTFDVDTSQYGPWLRASSRVGRKAGPPTTTTPPVGASMAAATGRCAESTGNHGVISDMGSWTIP